MQFLRLIINRRSLIGGSLTTMAAVITIGQFVLHWDLPFSDSRTLVPPVPAPSSPPVQLESSVPTAVPVLVPTVGPTTTPAPVAHLNKQLEEALSVTRSSARSHALLIVVQDAVLNRDYWTAIRAASKSPSSSAQARSLGIVVKCAIEDGLYDSAAEAADRVKITSARDRLRIDVIEARKQETSDVQPSDGDRHTMACLS